ncbi:MAG: PilN domain-containing protein [Phycisphaeraceae bacterium]
MSFLPEDYLEKRAARRTNLVCLTLFGIVMLGLIAAFVVSSRQDVEVRELHRQVNRDFEEAARRIEQLEQLQRQKQDMVRKAQVTGVLLERVPRSLLMAELINHMPPTLSLTELDLSTSVIRTSARPRTAIQREQERLQQAQAAGESPQIEVPETELTVNLIGVAPTDVEVAMFMTSLSNHEMFYDVNLQFSEQTTIEEQTMRQFRIEMKIDQEIDFNEIEPTLVSRELKSNPMSDQMRIDASGELIAPGAHVQPAWDDQ